MRLSRIATDQRGFSLLELLVALLILAFVALGIASLFSHAQLTNASGYDYAVLASEARRALEDLMATPFNDAALTDTAGTPRQLTTARRGFDIRYTVQDFQVLTWNQLTIHDKPIYILNSGGFYDHLVAHIQQMREEQFLYEEAEKRIRVIFCAVSCAAACVPMRRTTSSAVSKALAPPMRSDIE